MPLVPSRLVRANLVRTRLVPVGLAGVDFGLAAGSGNVYLLDDEFTDTRPAGAVNNTLATPGPGTRVVTDTTNKLSLSNDFMVFTTPVGWGDPGFYNTSPIARSPGRVVLFKYKINQTAGGYESTCGLISSGAVPSFNSIGIRQQWSNGGFYFRDGMVTCSGVYTVGSSDTPFAIVLRSSGFYGFVKSTTWILHTVYSAGNYANLYYGFSSPNHTGRMDWYRVPATLWLPTPLAYTDFTQANGALAATSAVGPDNQSAPSLAWTNQQGTVQVSGNAAIATALDGTGRAICTVPTPTADVLLDANVTKATTGAGIVLRYQDSDNYVYMWHNGTNLLFVSRAGGVETTLVNAAAAYGAGRTIRGILSGTSGSSYYNNVQIGATQVVPASTHSIHGLIFFDTDSTLDVFQAFPRGTSNEYARLDTWSGATP